VVVVVRTAMAASVVIIIIASQTGSNHPYGYGSAEPLRACIEGAFDSHEVDSLATMVALLRNGG
jgi:hypothetical protein